MWIQREISKAIQANSDPIQILRGPRQCGKTSLLLHLGPEFQELSLDDPSLRELAQNDPELFLKQFDSEKLLIDEAQYAPALFPSLKRRADLIKRNPAKRRQTWVRMTGSNQILMDRTVKESLAGRASFFDLNTLSVSEILASQPETSIQKVLYQGGWPDLYVGESRDPKKYLDDYINSYIEKDVVLAAGIQKAREFLRFVKLLAGRVGELVEMSSLGREAGVDTMTIKDWLSVLERMNVIVLLPPFASNLSTRLTKSPKVFFIDNGLACRLQGWTSSGPIATSPQQGHLFENLVFSEIFKLNINFQLGWTLYHWRSRDGEEVDFLIERGPGDFVFVEAKVSSQAPIDLSERREISKVFKKNQISQILCHQEGSRVLDRRVPIAFLARELLAY